MKFTIINGTNRIGNKSLEVSKATEALVRVSGHEVKLITLDNFGDLFRGEYINLSNAKGEQKTDLENMLWADVIIFVVPTYHHGIPSSLKNFLDIVNDVDVFEGKMIGFIGVGHSNDGIRQTGQIVNGIFSYNRNKSYIFSKECLINSSNIDTERIANYIKYCVESCVL